jgi:hypothetical protein
MNKVGDADKLTELELKIALDMRAKAQQEGVQGDQAMEDMLVDYLSDAIFDAVDKLGDRAVITEAMLTDELFAFCFCEPSEEEDLEGLDIANLKPIDYIVINLRRAMNLDICKYFGMVFDDGQPMYL